MWPSCAGPQLHGKMYAAHDIRPVRRLRVQGRLDASTWPVCDRATEQRASSCRDPRHAQAFPGVNANGELSARSSLPTARCRASVTIGRCSRRVATCRQFRPLRMRCCRSSLGYCPGDSDSASFAGPARHRETPRRARTIRLGGRPALHAKPLAARCNSSHLSLMLRRLRLDSGPGSDSTEPSAGLNPHRPHEFAPGVSVTFVVLFFHVTCAKSS